MALNTHLELCIQGPLVVKETWQNLILGCSGNLSCVSPQLGWCPWFSNSIRVWPLHSHWNSYWCSLGIDHQLIKGASGQVLLMPLLFLANLYRCPWSQYSWYGRANLHLESWGGEDLETWEEQTLCMLGNLLQTHGLQGSVVKPFSFLGKSFCSSEWMKTWSAHWKQHTAMSRCIHCVFFSMVVGV